MTEHSGFVFVAYFLAEYSNIALISCITSLLWLGGSSLPFIGEIAFISGIVLGIKALLLMFTVIWVRGTLPRLRFDQLATFCWENLLPFAIAYIIFIPCLIVTLI